MVQGDKGYGFIAVEGGPDVFVHVSAIAGGGYRSLEEGQKVEFDITQGQNDARAGYPPGEERTAARSGGPLIGMSPDELAGHRLCTQISSYSAMLPRRLAVLSRNTREPAGA